MISVKQLKDTQTEEFKRLFADYYTELGCDEDANHLVGEYILPDLIAGLISIDMINDGETCAGFVIYQIDDIDNEWNFMEGWGDIREIYIIPSLRRTGLGKFILYTAEMRLKERGATKSYALPAAGSEKFFESCGYEKTEIYDGELDAYVYEKLKLGANCSCK